MEAVKTVNLTKYYGKTRGIVDLNITIKRGEFFGFIGPNGAGKSTTIRTLLGLIAPTGGSAQIFGMDIVKEKKSVLHKIGYLPSEAIFYSGMKVKELLQLAADLRKKDCMAESRVLCERLQLDVNRKIEELSFGNRKKAAIVCALQHRPELLILDEPTGGLDPLMQKEFFDILQERSQEGTTVFLSSHVLSEVQRNCTRAAIIRDGRIIACDSVEALSRTNAKRVCVRGSVNLDILKKKAENADSQCFYDIRDRKDSGDSVSFLFSGDINALLRLLADSKIHDLTITEPDLEEIFLHYYEKGGDRV